MNEIKFTPSVSDEIIQDYIDKKWQEAFLKVVSEKMTEYLFPLTTQEEISNYRTELLGIVESAICNGVATYLSEMAGHFEDLIVEKVSERLIEIIEGKKLFIQ